MKIRQLEHGTTLWVGPYKHRADFLFRLYVYNGKAIKLGCELPDKKIKPFLKALGVKFRPQQYGAEEVAIGCSLNTTSNLTYVQTQPRWRVDDELQAFYNTLGNRSVAGLLFPDEEKSADRWLIKLREGITGEPEGDAEEEDILY